MPTGDLPEKDFEFLREQHLQRRQEIGEQIKDYVHQRERQVVEDMRERSNLNYFSFAFVGGALALNPGAMHHWASMIGGLIVFINGSLFGWVAQWHQRKINIKHFENMAEETQNRFRTILAAYKNVLQLHSRESEVAYGDAATEFNSWREGLSKDQRMAKKTPLNIGVFYIPLLLTGMALVSMGVFLSATKF